MSRATRLLLSCLLASIAAAPALAQSGYDAVDPMIGTGPQGHTYPGATVPFGMVQPSPDSNIVPFRHSYAWAAGYSYSDTTILGFSQTHFAGAGHSDLGDFLIQPISGDVRLAPGDEKTPLSGYRSRFSHSSEIAHPGYYAVTLDDYKVRAELTATMRVGLNRFTFPADQPAHVLLDMRSSIYAYPGKILWSSVRIGNDGTITGMRMVRGWAPGRPIYFAMRFSAPMTGHSFTNHEDQPVLYGGFATPGTTPETKQAIDGRGVEAVFNFGQLSAPLTVAIAISPTDEQHAVANLDAEQKQIDFDGTRTKAEAAWRNALGVLDIDADKDTRISLYTSLYHALLSPTVSMDTDGSYRGPDNQTHIAKNFDFVSTFSLWDTFRAEHPLLTIIQPRKVTENIIDSLMVSQKESPFGLLPIWQYEGLETWCMTGYPAVPVLADEVTKGFAGPDGFDANDALKSMVASASYAPYGHLEEYMKLGYVPIDHDGEAASKTMEYAYEDWTIAETAHRLGQNAIADEYRRRSENWRNVFNTKDGFVEPKFANGEFRTPFDPARAGNDSGFTEGNSWQYSWFEPQDEASLIKVLGGDDKLIAKLDAMFDQKVDPRQYADVEDIAGLIGQYIHGNEPSHHLAFLYTYAGQPWRTQERLAQIISSQYHLGPDGLVGNDDLGQMSAWLLFNSLGFYPVTPGTDQYVIGRPFVKDATIHLPNGKQFHVVAEHFSPQNGYVGKITLNGKPVEKTYLTQSQITDGGELRFEMQPKPNKTWGRNEADRPYSMSKDGWPQ